MSEYKVNLEPISSDEVKIQGSSFAIEDKKDSNVYLTSKPYMNKLFKLIGYKNLNVVQILEEYANKTVSSAGNLDTHQLYIDRITDSFIVTTPQSVEWVNAMLKFLSESTFTIDSVKRYDTYYNWDQLVVTNSFGSKFAIYINLLDECVEIVSLSYDKEGVLTGAEKECSYSFAEGQSSFDSFKVTISAPTDISSEFTLNQTLSIYEYVELLRSLGYVEKKRRHYYSTDKSSTLSENIDTLVDMYNESSWLKRHIKETPTRTSFYDACKVITENLDDHTYWSFLDFFNRNRTESSDIFVLNS